MASDTETLENCCNETVDKQLYLINEANATSRSALASFANRNKQRYTENALLRQESKIKRLISSVFALVMHLVRDA